eukprot:CAMPEP_0169208770 /NCGR_PEP_ID=MMETSP1016-20121227/14313_1 /TAXON_ID=342587 /ORGANISM="Karlodinium micrum, Strain CCMP2283" /LENGTH=209 /DNA_ID=CAMNT_0009286175 /DNA_START=48 /DNA_END=675 /DNA_ORIENTATION=+
MTAVVVPGRKLLPDGSPPPILLARMEAAVKACRDDPEFKLLILSGGKMPMNEDEIARLQAAGRGRPPSSEAEVMKDLALQLGLDRNAEIVLEIEALNTVENAVNVRQMLEARGGVERLLVITSTFHLPRVQQSFESIFEGSAMALQFSGSDDLGTAAEREREVLVEPAMIERLPPQARIYRRYYEGQISLEEARRRFFHKDEPHSDVWL